MSHEQADPPATPSLGRVLKELGFETSADEGGDFDWLYAYPAARPLLDAISTRFSPECVLSVEEADDYERICQRHPPPLPPTDAREIVAPLSNASHLNISVPKSANSARTALHTALRQKLSTIQALTAVVRDAVGADNASETDDELSNSRDDPEFDLEEEEVPSEVQAELHDHLDELERISRYSRSQISSPTSTSSPRLTGESNVEYEAGDIFEYVREERRENEQIAASIEELSQKLAVRPGNEAYDKDLVSDPQLCKLVENYAELRARSIMLETDLARKCATIDALLTNSGEQLDTEGYESASHLYEDLKARAQEAEQSLSDDVSKRASQWLWNRIRSQALDHILKRQQSYITQLESYIAALVEQRIRIMCVSVAQSRRNELASDLMRTLVDLETASSSLVLSNSHSGSVMHSSSPRVLAPRSESVCSESTSMSITRNLDNSFARAEVDDEDSPSKGRDPANKGLQRHICASPTQHSKVDTTTVDEVEDSVFKEIIGEGATLFEEFRNRIGCERCWLDLDVSPDLKASVKQLEEEVSSNSVVLETLLYNRNRIQDCNAAATSFNREWIQLVNGRIRPK